jgi:hypothetical protein
MVTRVVDPRNGQDSAAFRGYPVSGLTQKQSAPAQDTPSTSGEFSTGSDPAPDVTPVSTAGHVTGRCGACQRGEQDHWNFHNCRKDQTGVLTSRFIGTT